MGSSNTDVSVKILRVNTRKLLSDILNSTKVIRSDEGLCRDWRGFAHLCGVQPTNCGRNQNPMEEVLTKWQDSDDATVTQLFELLEKLDRFDIISDCKDMINEDIQLYLTARDQTQVVSQTQMALTPNDLQILTVDDIYRRDRGLEPQIYDAVVLYDEQEWEAVQTIVTRLELCNFKLCLKERDIIPGVSFEHETFMTLIKERCNRVIILLSPNFVQSPFNNFLHLYTQAVSIEERARKLIPCVYKYNSKQEIPKEYRFYTMLWYNQIHTWPDIFWNRLIASISSSSTAVRNNQPSSTVNIQELPSSEIGERPTQVQNSITYGDKSTEQYSSDASTEKSLTSLHSETGMSELDCDKSCNSLKDRISYNYDNENEKKRTFCRIPKLLRKLISSKSDGIQSKKKYGSKCAVMAD